MEVRRQGAALVFRVDHKLAPSTCGQAVSTVLQLTEKECIKAFGENLVRIGHRVAKADDLLRSGETVRVLIAAGPLQGEGLSTEEPQPSAYPVDIVYEDDHVLVVDKPHSMIMYQGADEGGPTLANAVAYHYELTGQNAYVRAVHRLDRDTTGASLYAKHLPALRILSGELTDRRIHREYLALVQGVPYKSSDVIAKELGRDRHVAGRMRVHPGGMPALTHYVTLWKNERYALLRCELSTGRTHQIRVHLASVGLPIIGDELYGAPSTFISRQALHAVRIVFPAPYEGRELRVLAPLPADFVAACHQAGVPLQAIWDEQYGNSN